MAIQSRTRPANAVGRHAGVRRHHQFGEPVHADGHDAREVAVQNGLEGLETLPFGVLGRQSPDAVDHEMRLGGQRLFDPQRAVIVEHGDAVGRGDEIGVAHGGHAGDEIKDRLPRRAVSPGRQQRAGGFGRSRHVPALEQPRGRSEGTQLENGGACWSKRKRGNGSAIMRSR